MPDLDPTYELTFENRKGYLYARVRASAVTAKMAHNYLSRVAEKCARLKCSNLLFERDIPAVLPDSDVYSTARKFAQATREVKIAFVNPYPGNDDAIDFWMMISNNLGAKVAAHRTIEQAERWLV